MSNINRLLNSLHARISSRQIKRMRPRQWILGITLGAALLSWGCPKQDPLQAFSPPATPIDQGPAPVPEPATALLFGAALLIGGAIARRRRKGGTNK
jgi:PEP-CTERM motif-containing protein